jgi:dissimilatory sulfite reductase (desulfoviridin) alpha/beta subunit
MMISNEKLFKKKIFKDPNERLLVRLFYHSSCVEAENFRKPVDGSNVSKNAGAIQGTTETGYEIPGDKGEEYNHISDPLLKNDKYTNYGHTEE